MTAESSKTSSAERATRLKHLRARLRLRMGPMGAKLGVKAATVSAYERGLRDNPEPVWKLIRIVEVLGF